MAKTRSIVSIKDGTSHVTFVYVRVNPSTGANFDNNNVTGIPSAVIAIYDTETDALLQASTGMTYSAILSGFRYVWTYTGTAKNVNAIIIPTRGSSVAPALVPNEQVFADLADVLNRIDVDTAAVSAEVDAQSTVIQTAITSAKNAVLAEVDAQAAALEGAGWASGTDTLHQLRLAINALQSSVNALDLGQSTSLIVPQQIKPGTTVTCYLEIKNDNGVLVDADSGTLAWALLEGSVSGVTLSGWARASAGRYSATIGLTSGVSLGQALTPRATWQRTEGSIVNNESATRQALVNDFSTDLDSILNNTQTLLTRMGVSTDATSAATLFGKENLILADLTDATTGLPNIQSLVAAVKADLEDGTIGLSAIKTAINNLAAQVGTDGVSIQAKLGAFTAILTLKALLGAFDTTSTVLANLQAIQGQVG